MMTAVTPKNNPASFFKKHKMTGESFGSSGIYLNVQ